MFVIFDYDGVIFNSVPAITDAVTRYHRHLGLGDPPVDEPRRWLGPSIRDSLMRVSHEQRIELDLEAETEYFFDLVSDATRRLWSAFDGAVELVQDLMTAGASVGIATMKARTEMAELSGCLPALDLVHTVAAPADHHGGTSKKQLVAEVIADLGASIDDQGWMIGDRASDIDAGRSHGLTTVAACWGGGTRTELENAEPDHLVSTMDELRALLLPAAMH